MFRYLLLFSFISQVFLFTAAQTDTSHLRISLLTCSPGEDLYSTFGHSALRVTDSAGNEDIVYNYGTFDFDEPGFYIKFTRGKLMYYLSTEEFASFADFYKRENRGITEQVLQLTPAEKNGIKGLLLQNLMSENRFYKYDFLFDNCTTRLRDLVEKTADTTVSYGKVVPDGTRFRQLIHKYLDRNDKQWSKLGIDLLLGSKTDAVMTNREVMFLPDYLMEAFNHTKIGRTPVVASAKSLHPFIPQSGQNNFLAHPGFIFSLLLIIVIMQGFSKNPRIKKIINGFDGVLFFITGMLGILMLFMWFGTDHLMCRNNYNLLWAWPIHIIFAFFTNSRKNYVKIYFRFSLVVSSVVLLTWFFLPQQMNAALLPFIMLLIVRSAAIGYRQEFN